MRNLAAVTIVLGAAWCTRPARADTNPKCPHVLIGLTAVSDMRGDARVVTQAEGAGLMIVGTWLGIYSATKESANEREWRRYRNGQQLGERAATSRLVLTPVLAPHSALISLTGVL